MAEKLVGRDVAVLIALSDSDTVPADETFEDLGAVRGAEFGPEWDTVDMTARGTGLTRENLVTFKNHNISLDGIRVVDLDGFQQDVEDHVEAPPAAMNNQPYAWVRFVIQRKDGSTRVKSYRQLLTSFRESAPYDGEYSYTLEGVNAGGEPVVTNVPAPV